MKKKIYRIYCETEQQQVSGVTYLLEPPDECPNDPSHIVDATSKVIVEEIEQGFITATTLPTKFNDVTEGFEIGSRWIDVNTNFEYVCVDNAIDNSIWKLYSFAGSAPTNFIWQVHKTTTGNNNMSNGTWFDNFGGRYLTGSWSGYASNCTPLVMPFDTKISKIIFTFRYAAFDWRATTGNIFLTLEFRTMTYNGSNDACQLVLELPGNFSGNNTGTDTFKFEITNFEEFTGINFFTKHDLVGVMLRKARSEAGYINSVRNPVIQFHFVENV